MKEVMLVENTGLGEERTVVTPNGIVDFLTFEASNEDKEWTSKL